MFVSGIRSIVGMRSYGIMKAIQDFNLNTGNSDILTSIVEKI